MTQNDIAYYNARKEAKDARLRRRETKRHNIESETADKTRAAASVMSAQASMLGSQAAAQNAATNRANYELEWSKEYGYDYGEPTQTGWVMNVNTGESVWYDHSNPERDRAVSQWTGSQGDDIIITIPSGKYGTPQSYVQKELAIAKGVQDVRVGESTATKNFWDTIKSGASTVQILVDTGSNVLFGKEERNKKGGR